MAGVRAEHPSLVAFLEQRLTVTEMRSVLLPTFTQWSFSLAALSEIALASRECGAEVSFAFWGGKTPLPDVGWTCDRWVAHLSASRTRDEWTERALRASGFPRGAFIPPPIRHWKPKGELPSNPPRSRGGIRELTYEGTPMGRAILQLRPDHAVPVTDDYRWPGAWLERSMRSYAYVFDQVSAVIEQRGVSAVAVSNGRFLHDRAAAEAALSSGVAVLYYDYGGADTAFDLTREKTHDWAALQERMRQMFSAWPDEDRDRVGSAWFEGRRTHTDTANAAFTDAQVLGRGIDVPAGKRLVVFFSSSGDEFAEFELDWSDYFGGQPQALLEVAAACRKAGDVHFVVRSHPHKRRKAPEDVRDWHAAVSAANPDLHLDEWSDIDSYELMKQADLVVTYGSTTGVEAAYQGRPVMVMGPSAYDELGCAARPRTREQILAIVTSPPAPDVEGALAFGLMMKRRGFALNYLDRKSDGSLVLGRQPIGEPHEVSRKLAHMLHARHRTSISEGMWTS